MNILKFICAFVACFYVFIQNNIICQTAADRLQMVINLFLGFLIFMAIDNFRIERRLRKKYKNFENDYMENLKKEFPDLGEYRRTK